MSIISSATHLDVFKFKSSGLVALCEEIVEDKAAGYLDKVDLGSAQYIDAEGHHIIRFRYKDEVTAWCYICEVEMPKDEREVHDLRHCGGGQHCTSQAPECGTDMGPGMDHERPYVCCTCGAKVT